MDCGELGIVLDFCLQNVGDVVFELYDVGSDDVKVSFVSVLEFVFLVEVGDFGYVVMEEKGLVMEEVVSRDVYFVQLDVFVRDGFRDVGFLEGVVGVNEVRCDM